MGAYILRRLLLIVPTILGILTVTFVIVQFTPGGPVETIMAQLQGTGGDGMGNLSGGSGDAGVSSEVLSSGATGDSQYRGARGMDPRFLAELNQQFGFDKPALSRYGKMIWDYVRFDFGNSFFKGKSVLQLIGEALPVSISLGLLQLLISYSISIPLGIKKAVKDGTPFDIWTSSVIIMGYAIPSFLFGVMLLVVFAGGSFFDWFPLGHLRSDNFDELSFFAKITDYACHLALPLLAMVISAFATKTLLTKNCFLEEIRKQYVVTARAKGLSERSILYGHIFRNAMLVVIAGFPSAFIASFFTGSILIETTFSLNGLGVLGFESIVSRDYPVVFGTLFIFSLIGLVVNLISDLIYMWVDPRIDFDNRDVS